MTYKLLYWPDPFLRIVADPIEDFEGIDIVCTNLFKTMYADKGIGLAATQCGINKRIFVMDTVINDTGICKAFINPEILETEGTVMYPEGCLSFPNIYVKIERPEKMKLRHTLLTGETEDVILEGLSSICAHHEIDHLNGKVFFDYLGPAKKQMLEQKLRKEIKKLRKKK